MCVRPLIAARDATALGNLVTGTRPGSGVRLPPGVHLPCCTVT